MYDRVAIFFERRVGEFEVFFDNVGVEFLYGEFGIVVEELCYNFFVGLR